MQLECFARTEIGNVRATNQDAIGCFPDLGLFAVADGMGGHEFGEVASRMAVETLQASFRQATAAEPQERLVAAVGATNQAIYHAGRPSGRISPRPMGTTVIALALSMAPRHVSWAYVGDSRLYRYRKGELRLFTADHTRYGGPFAASTDVPLDLPHTNELLAALGIESWVRPGRGTDDWADGDVYMLCSDGISGMISPTQMESELAQDATVDEIGTGLISRALAAGGSDNASVVIVRVSS